MEIFKVTDAGGNYAVPVARIIRLGEEIKEVTEAAEDEVEAKVVRKKPEPKPKALDEGVVTK